MFNREIDGVFRALLPYRRILYSSFPNRMSFMTKISFLGTFSDIIILKDHQVQVTLLINCIQSFFIISSLIIPL
jgi:hypothetical protein